MRRTRSDVRSTEGPLSAADARDLAGRVVPERSRQHVREVFVRTYRVVYAVREGGIVVLTVFEGHRLFPADVERDG